MPLNKLTASLASGSTWQLEQKRIDESTAVFEALTIALKAQGRGEELLSLCLPPLQTHAAIHTF